MAIRVIVVLDKGGTNTDVEHLGTLTLANTSGLGTLRSYDVIQHGKDVKKTVKRARVERFPSLQVSVWKLVARALKELGHGDV